MKIHKSRPARVLAAAAALLLTALLLAAANSFVGNPVSAGLLTLEARRYVANTYPGQNLSVEWAQYSFKTGSYRCAVQSPESPDTRFSVFRVDGELRDDYETYVKGRFHTWARLDKEVDRYLDALVEREFSRRTRLVLGQLSEETEALTLDMALDIHSPPGELSLTVWCEAERPTYEELAEVLLELRDLCRRDGTPVARYSVSLEATYVEDENKALMPSDFDRTVYLFDYPAEEIHGDAHALAPKLEEFHRRWEKASQAEKEMEERP